MSDEISLTEFNGNVATLMRVDTLLKLCADAAYNNDFEAYFRHLRNLRKEARVKMKHLKKEGKCKKDCPRCVVDSMFEKIQDMNDLYVMHKRDSVLMKDFPRKLDEFELYLRDFMNDKGMLLTDNTDVGL